MDARQGLAAILRDADLRSAPQVVGFFFLQDVRKLRAGLYRFRIAPAELK
jgi:hypothetical protein